MRGLQRDMIDLRRADLIRDEPKVVEEAVEGSERSFRYLGSYNYLDYRIEYVEGGFSYDTPMLDAWINAYACIPDDVRKPMQSLPNVTHVEHTERGLEIGVDTQHARNSDMDLGERFRDATRQIREAIDAPVSKKQCLRCDRFRKKDDMIELIGRHEPGGGLACEDCWEKIR